MSKNISLSSSSLLLLAILFLACVLYVGFVPIQQDFVNIIIPYTLGFCFYLFFIFKLDTTDHFVSLLCLAVVARFILVFSFPNLSDDIYRFLWDAELVLDGRNPYLLLPDNIVTPDNQELYEKLNSQSYYSPYPPVAQILYTIAALLSDSDIRLFSMIIKLFTLLAEIGTIFYMIKIMELINIEKASLFIYALNPLIMIELMGNLHFESFMVLFTLGTVYYLIKSKNTRSALVFVLAIASKLLPLMFTPFILGYLGVKKSFKYIVIMSLSMLLIFIPIIIGVLNGTFLSSVGLYFQKFEFNASLYYLLREVGFMIYGWNVIGTLGPTLGLMTVGIICAIWYKVRHSINSRNIFYYLLFTISVYLFTATTIHPWYVALPLAFCLFTEFRFPVIWSGLIFFTYYNYSQSPYEENLWIVLIEYVIVFSLLFLEIRNLKNNKNLSSN